MDRWNGIKALMIGGFLLPSVLLGADTAATQQPSAASSPPAVTAEMRESMAKTHERMAACLRSKRPLEECQNEMMDACQKMMGGAGACPMMGAGMMRGPGKGSGPMRPR